MADVNDLITDARQFAANAFSSASSMVGNAANAIGGLGSRFTVSGPSLAEQPAINFNLPFPEFQNVTLEVGSAPDAPTGLANLPDLDIGPAPVNRVVNPGFVDPAKPAPLRELSLTVPTINTSFTFPAMPAALENINIIAPTLIDRAVPDAPQLHMPEFTATAPTDDITPPTDLAEKFESAYRSMAPTMASMLDSQMDSLLARYNPRFKEQMANLESKLAAYLEGGSALSPAVENALYERTRDKANAEYKRTRDGAYADAARRGFTLPNGTLQSTLQQARQSAADNNARAAIEIGIKQAELEQQNIQFAITTSSSLRTAVMGAAISYHGSLVGLNAQVLDYAKSILSAAIEVYNTLVKAYGMRLDAYKAEANVYEVRLNGVMALIKIYEAEISAIEMLTKVDLAKVDIFKARLESLNTLATVYRSQIDAVVSQANVEKIKIELYGDQVRAYATEAQAKNSEWQGYSAAIGGQEARIRAYGEENRAYAAQVEGYRATIAAKQAQVQSITSYNDGIFRQYSAAMEGYRAVVSARGLVASTQVDLQRTQLTAFTAQISAKDAEARLQQEHYRTKATLGQASFNAVADVAVKSAELNMKQIASVAGVSLDAARVYQGIAGAALSGMNTLITKSDN